MASYKQIQTAHEVRMWLKEVIIPAVGVGIVVASNPQTRAYVNEKVGKAKKTIKSKFRKKEKWES